MASGANDVVMAGGAELMSNVSTPRHCDGAKGEAMCFDDALARGRITAGGGSYPAAGGMIETAENLRRDYEIPRDEQDAYAVESHRRAVAAQGAGCSTTSSSP
ncbi:hypothetical protein AB5I41_14560 [Sphingomonas sp. MMS24-JH45]